jgi:hypothetical protein
MTAAGDQVLAVARGEIGVAEDAWGNVKYWDWYGANYGAWCACFVSWCCEMAGYPMCPIDSSKGFILVSNGTSHSYDGWEVAQEAQRTVDLQPGDVVLFSWETWRWDGNVPVVDGGPYDGWVAGDHTGLVSAAPSSDGWFSAVEGNTSSLSYDNGGEVRERSDRHTSQVCGWWRPRNYGDTPTTPEDEMTDADFARIEQIVHDQIVNIWREQEMANLDTARAQAGAHEATLGIVRSEEFANIVHDAVD